MMLASLERKVTGRPAIAAPLLSNTVALSCTLVPLLTHGFAGERATAAGLAPGPLVLLQAATLTNPTTRDAHDSFILSSYAGSGTFG
jgi:hypothetical protein